MVRFLHKKCWYVDDHENSIFSVYRVLKLKLFIYQITFKWKLLYKWSLIVFVLLCSIGWWVFWALIRWRTFFLWPYYFLLLSLLDFLSFFDFLMFLFFCSFTSTSYNSKFSLIIHLGFFSLLRCSSSSLTFPIS